MKTFKDNFDIYFLVEFVKGIELFEVIRDIGNFFFNKSINEDC